MNNVYDNFPAIMSDGRNSNWTPSALLTEQIRKRENINTNWDYRAYLQKHANSIMDYNKSMAKQQM